MSVASECTNISNLIIAANAVNTVAEGGGDDAILSAITNLEHGTLLPLAGGAGGGATVSISASKSYRVAEAVARLGKLLASRGYVIG